MALPQNSYDWGGESLLVKGVQPALKPGGRITTVPASCVHTGGGSAPAAATGTDTAIVATTTYVAMVFVPCNTIVTGIAVLLGSVSTNGHIAVALADSTGAVVARSTSATISTSTLGAYQRVPFSATYQVFGPGVYYVMVQADSTTDKIRTHTTGSFPTQSVTAGTFNTFATFTPATTFTTAVGPVASLY